MYQNYPLALKPRKPHSDMAFAPGEDGFIPCGDHANLCPSPRGVAVHFWTLLKMCPHEMWCMEYSITNNPIPAQAFDCTAAI